MAAILFRRVVTRIVTGWASIMLVGCYESCDQGPIPSGRFTVDAGPVQISGVSIEFIDFVVSPPDSVTLTYLSGGKILSESWRIVK